MNILIPVYTSIRYRYQAFLCKQLLIVEVEFSARDKAALCVKIEGAVTWFRGIQYSSIKRLVIVGVMVKGYCISNIDLAKKYVGLFLSLHHAKETAGDAK